MITTETNNSENGTKSKPRWKRPKEKENFTEAEMRLIKAGREVLKVIQKQIERGDFDEYLDKEKSKL